MKQRFAYLLENEEDHLSAEDVYLLVKEKSPEIGLATVYRTLELLTELKIVDKINFGDGVSRYDLRTEGAAHFHHHLVCIECGAVDEIQEDLLDDVEAKVEQKWNFKIKRSPFNLSWHLQSLSRKGASEII